MQQPPNRINIIWCNFHDLEYNRNIDKQRLHLTRYAIKKFSSKFGDCSCLLGIVVDSGMQQPPNRINIISCNFHDLEYNRNIDKQPLHLTRYAIKKLSWKFGDCSFLLGIVVDSGMQQPPNRINIISCNFHDLEYNRNIDKQRLHLTRYAIKKLSSKFGDCSFLLGIVVDSGMQQPPNRINIFHVIFMI